MATLIDLDKHISPAQADLEIADRSASTLVDVLRSKSDNGLIPHSVEAPFLIGSLPRGTKILPLDDVDIVYTIGTARAVINNPNAAYEVEFCSLDTTKYSSKETAEGNISSRQVINSFRSVLAERYSRSEVSRSGEVVNVYLDTYGIGFDVVPAFWIVNKDHYVIPEGAGGHGWKPTNPLNDAKFLNGIDARHGGHVRPAIRLVKWWAKRRKIRSPRSYHLESIMREIFANAPPSPSLARAVVTSLSGLSETQLLGACPDPLGLSAPLTSSLSVDDIKKIKQTARDSVLQLLNDERQFVQTLVP